MSIASPAFVKKRNKVLESSKNSSIELGGYAAGHHLLEIAIAQLIRDVPANTESNDWSADVTGVEENSYVCMCMHLLKRADLIRASYKG